MENSKKGASEKERSEGQEDGMKGMQENREITIECHWNADAIEESDGDSGFD